MGSKSIEVDKTFIQENLTQLESEGAFEIKEEYTDLDSDGDQDYILTYYKGESAEFEIFMNDLSNFKKVLHEYGNLQLEFDPIDKTGVLFTSIHNHCCGESPFSSNRKYIFEDNHYRLIKNYVEYNASEYCKDKPSSYVNTPSEILIKSYRVKTNSPLPVRFSADLRSHDASFVCQENSNIIAYLKPNAEVQVLAEEKLEDQAERTWLYVEIEEKALNTQECESPLTYDFENQKLRGWISNKNVSK